VGTGFWVIQGVFLMAAIATAIYAEVERRRDSQGLLGSDDRQVPVERSNIFTIHEQARLLLLRGRVREARRGSGRLRDDLAPDSPEHFEQSVPRQAPAARTVIHVTHASDGRRPEAPLLRRWSAGGWLLVAGLLLFAVGIGGMWHTNLTLDALELAQAPFSTAPRMSFAARVLPGPIANPARYFAAVNGGSASATFQAAAFLEQKQAMDRWEGAVLLGLALLIASFSHPGGTTRGGETSSSIAGDLVGFIALAALVCAGLSFFELV
jgi:hypothetical protein